MCCCEESLELLNVWYVIECQLEEALEDEAAEDIPQAA